MRTSMTPSASNSTASSSWILTASGPPRLI
jgi:hypothetical protein